MTITYGDENAIYNEAYNESEDGGAISYTSSDESVATVDVNGKDGRIAPTEYTTRAEVAVLLQRILEYVK